MTSRPRLLLLSLAVVLVACGSDPEDAAGDPGPAPTSLVDPFVGTAGDHGQLSPAAAVPFGMVKLGPDTSGGGHAGYDFGSDQLNGFSHTRIGGVGCSGAGGGVRLRPGVGAFDWSRQSVWMDKATERAAPGSYAVTLGGDAPIAVELAATAHAGLHRYTFPAAGPVHVHVALNAPFDFPLGSSFEVSDDRTEISGWTAGKNVCAKGQYRIHFSLRFSQAWDSVAEVPGGLGLGVDPVPAFQLAAPGDLWVKVGLSSVSVARAREDRALEIPGWDLEAVRAAATRGWDELLGRIEVAGGDDELRRLFTTFLYRSLLTPVDITAAGAGEYRGTDGEVHAAAAGHRHLHGWSIWDTYRTKYPLLSLVAPGWLRHAARSLTELYLEGKVDWAADQEPYPTVRTEHAVAVLLDAHHKGLGHDAGLAAAWAAIRQEVDTRPEGSPDQALEASYDRWAAAGLADLLGRDAAHDELLAAVGAYRDRWLADLAELGDDADVVHGRGLYEGTVWQYRWAVPHDVPGLVTLAGGEDAFRAQLDQYFDEELHNHGNEPALHAPFLFHYVGAPDRTQEVVWALLVEPVDQWYGTHEKWSAPHQGRIFRLEPDGLLPEMDDDAGTMAAWFVLAAIGLYPVTVGQPVYLVLAPLFEVVTLHLENEAGAASTFVIRADGVSADRPYVRSASLNGRALTRAWLAHQELVAGGELVLEMGSAPGAAWGRDPADRPPGGLAWLEAAR